MANCCKAREMGNFAFARARQQVALLHPSSNSGDPHSAQYRGSAPIIMFNLPNPFMREPPYLFACCFPVSLCQRLVRSKTHTLPMGVVMFAGYAGPGWVWPRAVRGNSCIKSLNQGFRQSALQDKPRILYEDALPPYGGRF